MKTTLAFNPSVAAEMCLENPSIFINFTYKEVKYERFYRKDLLNYGFAGLERLLKKPSLGGKSTL